MYKKGRDAYYISNMEKGFNTDVSWNGFQYHVQTEDWGSQNPFLVTRVFRNGTVLKSFKVSYEEALVTGPSRASQAIRLAMREQHQQILDLIHSGQLPL